MDFCWVMRVGGYFSNVIYNPLPKLFKTFYLLCLKISELDSTYVYSRAFFFFDLMVGVTHFGCFEHILSSHRAFMIDMHARTIYDDMDSSTFEHSVDCVESLRIST